MLLRQLLIDAGVTPRFVRGDADFSRLVCDSRRVRQGDCFLAVEGAVQDGHRYIPQALAAGAAAVVCSRAAAVPDGMPAAVLDAVRPAVGPLAQAAWGWPSRRITAVGVTGTNGKTTIAHMVRWALQSAGVDAAMFGTISYQAGGLSAPAGNTTPDPLLMAELMAQMLQAGQDHLVMEVSSHALDQRRTAGLDFRVGVFSNLTGDHLDYHGDMASYRDAKARLFSGLKPTAAAVVNADDPAGADMARASSAPVLWYGLGEGAGLRARLTSSDISGSRFDLTCAGQRTSAGTGLIGRHNVQNFLAAAGACISLGMDLQQAAEAIGRMPCVPGRLQRVAGEGPAQVFVDYVHTDDALANVLGALGQCRARRLIVVFGCGGDRDRTKRPRMAAVAERLADAVVVTSDNPRSERPEDIAADIMRGFSAAGRDKVTVELDRRSAIHRAIAAAGEGDVVLLAGKGHEDYQIIGDRRLHFDDVEVAREALSARGAPA